MDSNAEVTNPQGRTHKGKRDLFSYIALPFIATMLVTLVDALGILLVLGKIPRENLVLVMFFEGGVGLIAGVGISLSSTPSASAVSERLFGTSPWSRRAERHAERVGWRWLIASSFLILAGFAVSAV